MSCVDRNSCETKASFASTKSKVNAARAHWLRCCASKVEVTPRRHAMEVAEPSFEHDGQAKKSPSRHGDSSSKNSLSICPLMDQGICGTASRRRQTPRSTNPSGRGAYGLPTCWSAPALLSSGQPTTSPLGRVTEQPQWNTPPGRSSLDFTSVRMTPPGTCVPNWSS